MGPLKVAFVQYLSTRCYPASVAPSLSSVDRLSSLIDRFVWGRSRAALVKASLSLPYLMSGFVGGSIYRQLFGPLSLVSSYDVPYLSSNSGLLISVVRTSA